MYTPTPDYYRDYISHHGIDGQKWGVRNGPPYPLVTNNKNTLSSTSPKIKIKNGDYIYKKGTVIGRYSGQYKLNLNDSYPAYFYTNKKDRDVYKNRIGGEEDSYRLKKNIKIPNENKQIMDLYEFTKDRSVLDDPYEYWKDHINQMGPISENYLKYMKNKGYDALVDIRNSGYVADDPIMIISPKECIVEINKKRRI